MSSREPARGLARATVDGETKPRARKRFGRLTCFRYDELDGERLSVIEELQAALEGKQPRSIVDEEGDVTGGFNYLLIDPDIGRAFTALGAAITRQLRPRLRELSILECARALGSDYEWIVHVPVAQRAGLSDEEIEAIRRGADAATFDEDERTARRVIAALLERGELPETLYQEALERLGLVVLHRITVQAGYYATLFAMLTTFSAPRPRMPSTVFTPCSQGG